MATEDGKVIYKVVIDDNGVEGEAERAGRKAGDGIERGSKGGAGKFEQVMIGAARRIGEAFVEMAVKAVKGVEQIAQAGIEFNAKMEAYQTAFTTLLGNAEDADRVMSQIREDAAHTPFDVDSLTRANQMLISTGISADDARDDVLNLANAISATGGGSEELSRMAANMQQIKNAGKATQLDIRQFAYAGIDIYGLLADSMGITTEQAREMDVTYEQLSAALAKAAGEGGKYENALEKQSQTFQGRISTLKDNATQLAGALTEDLFAQLSNTALPMVMDWVATLLEAAQTGGIEGALEAAKGILSGLIDGFLENLPGLIDTGTEIIESLLNGIIDAIPKLIPIALEIILTLADRLTDPAFLINLLDAAFQLISALAEGLVDAIPTMVEKIPIIIWHLIEAFGKALPQIALMGLKLIVELANGIVQGIGNAVSAIGNLNDHIEASFENWVSGVSQWGWDLVNNFINGIVANANNLWNTLKGIAQGVRDFLGFSEPKKGPLSNFHTYAPDMMKLFSEGITDNEIIVYHAIKNAFNFDPIIPDGAELARQMTVNPGFISRYDIEREVSFRLQATGTTGGTTIVVPLNLDGREIARATAWSMGEQLAWEEL